MKQKEKTPREINRQRILDSYSLEDSVYEKEYDDITLIASQICNTPIALISIIDGDRQWFKSVRGLEVVETARELSFCTHAIEQRGGGIYEIEDARKSEKFAQNPFVIGEPYISFYAGAPLAHSEEINLGTLCVIDTKPRSLNANQKAALKALSRQVVSLFQKHKEVKLLENEKEQQVENLNNIPGMIFEASLDCSIHFINQYMCRYTGIVLEEDEVLNLKQIIHVSDHALLDHHMKRLKEEGEQEAVFQCKLVNREGTQFWVQQTLKLLDDKGNGSQRILGYIKDIGDTLDFSDMARERNTLLEQAQEVAKIGHWELLIEQKKVYWSKQTKLIHEVEADYKPNFEEAIKFYTSESLPIISKTVEKVIAEKSTWDTVLQIRTAKGRIRWVRTAGKYVESRRKGPSIIGVFQDVTDAKKYEETLLQRKDTINKLNRKLTKQVDEQQKELEETQANYEVIYNTAPDMMVSVDPQNGMIIECNQTTLDRLGYRKEEVVGKKIFSLYAPISHDYARDAFKELKEKGELRDKRLTLKTKSGEIVPVALNVSVVKDAKGKVVKTSSIWRDISELKRFEEKLQQLNLSLEETVRERTEQLRLANEDLESFVYISTHDIKSPLSDMQGYMEILTEKLEANEDPMINLSVDWINKLIQQAKGKVNSVIDVFKISNTTEVEELNPYQEIKEVVAAFGFLSIPKNASFSYTVPEGLKLTFNKVQFSSIFHNLIQNAIKYRKPDERLALAIGYEKEEEKHVFNVKDNGLGMDLEKNGSMLFKMFSRLHDHVEGSGMGLHLIKRILERNGGSISVVSKKEIGTEFTLKFKKE